MCFCIDHDGKQISNCMEFQHHMKFDCRGESVCEHNATCYYDNPDCQTAALCQCPKCYYGTRCSFSTSVFVLSLDAILGYHIESNTSILQQLSVIQVSAVLTMIMLVIELINGILCMIVFKNKTLHEMGCVLYITRLSVISPITMIIFTLNFWFLVLSQMASITNRSFLQSQCILVDFLSRICLSMDQWFSVCLAIEQTILVLQGANFNKNKSKQIAKWVIIGVAIFTASSVIQEPFNRQLIDDEDVDGKRTWCTIQYTRNIQIFDSIIHIINVAVPCMINLISAFVIIIAAVRQRAIAQTQKTYRQHLKEQLQYHRHLLTAPCVLVFLAIPRLVLAFSSGCMTSACNPWLFLIGYFISFIPPLVTFIIFVLPSQTYRKEFTKSHQRFQRAIRQCVGNN